MSFSSSYFLNLPIELKDMIMQQLSVRFLLNLGSVSSIFCSRRDNQLSVNQLLKNSDLQANEQADKGLRPSRAEN